jgi:hypothetical protein
MGEVMVVYRIYLVPFIFGTHSNLKTAEFTWNGNTFVRTSYINTDTKDFVSQASLFAIYSMKMSLERNYALTGGLNLYVYVYPREAYDKPKTQQNRLQPVNNYFKQGSGWTTIWYYVDTPGDVTLNIYTTDGRLVKRLFSGFRERGEYNEVWTGRDENNEVVSTGVYLIHFSAPGTNVIKKVCIVR